MHMVLMVTVHGGLLTVEEQSGDNGSTLSNYSKESQSIYMGLT